MKVDGSMRREGPGRETLGHISGNFGSLSRNEIWKKKKREALGEVGFKDTDLLVWEIEERPETRATGLFTFLRTFLKSLQFLKTGWQLGFK